MAVFLHQPQQRPSSKLLWAQPMTKTKVLCAGAVLVVTEVADGVRPTAVPLPTMEPPVLIAGAMSSGQSPIPNQQQKGRRQQPSQRPRPVTVYSVKHPRHPR
jgi:hypothetical protein